MDARVPMGQTWWDVTTCKECRNDKWTGFTLCEYHRICKSDDPEIRANAARIAEEKERLKREREEAIERHRKAYEREEARKWREYKKAAHKEKFYDACSPRYEWQSFYRLFLKDRRGSSKGVHESYYTDKNAELYRRKWFINYHLDLLEELEARNYHIYGDTRGHYQKNYKVKCTCTVELFKLKKVKVPWDYKDKEMKRFCALKSHMMDKYMEKINKARGVICKED